MGNPSKKSSADDRREASGVGRMSEIVDSLRNFSRLDVAEFQRVDIHQGIESSLTLLPAQLGDDISVVRNYADLAPVYCAPRQFNQVLMHLLENAIEAIENQGKYRPAPMRLAMRYAFASVIQAGEFRQTG